jgi:predicted metallo-beta-lactamase superfamily hydrolase
MGMRRKKFNPDHVYFVSGPGGPGPVSHSFDRVTIGYQGAGSYEVNGWALNSIVEAIRLKMGTYVVDWHLTRNPKFWKMFFALLEEESQCISFEEITDADSVYLEAKRKYDKTLNQLSQ